MPTAFFNAVTCGWILWATAATAVVPKQDAAPATNTQIEAWKFSSVQNLIYEGRTVYLELVLRNGQRKLWNPMSGSLKPFKKDERQKFTQTGLPPLYSYLNLPSGGKIRLEIEAPDPRHELSIGASYTYQEKDENIGYFYWIKKLRPPVRTFYRGTPLVQKLDADFSLLPLALPDDRLLLVNTLGREAIALQHIPKTIVSFDDEWYLVPAALLNPELDAAGEDQGARYEALLRVLTNNPRLMVHPKLID
jgi:hypothetical protein